MKVKFFAIILLSMFLLKIVADSSDKLSKDEKIVNAITSQTIKKIKVKTGLSACGTGGQMMYDIEMLGIAFQFFQTVTIEKARELLICCVDEYLSEINSNEELRQYLANYPFTAKNVEIKIYFCNPDGTKVKQGELVVASVIRGRVEYEIREPVHDRLSTVYEERYEEALQKIKK